MDTLVIHPVDEAQQKALQAILDGLKVPYDTEPFMDETAYLTSTQANKESLDRGIQDYKDGKETVINIEDLWK